MPPASSDAAGSPNRRPAGCLSYNAFLFVAHAVGWVRPSAIRGSAIWGSAIWGSAVLGCAEPVAGIFPGAQGLPPAAVGQVPVDRAGKAALEIVRSFPVQRLLAARWVDLVAEIVAGSIADKADQAFARASRIRNAPVEVGADRLYDLKVGARLSTADGIGLAGCSGLDHANQRLGMGLDEQPVAHVRPIAVDGQVLALQRVQGDQRDQLLRELPRAIVVACVRDDRRRIIGGGRGGGQ